MRKNKAKQRTSQVGENEGSVLKMVKDRGTGRVRGPRNLLILTNRPRNHIYLSRLTVYANINLSQQTTYTYTCPDFKVSIQPYTHPDKRFSLQPCNLTSIGLRNHMLIRTNSLTTDLHCKCKVTQPYI